MKFIIYTAVFGRIGDKLYPPQNIPDDIECHAFVDRDFGLKNGWLRRPAIWKHATNPRLRARRHKLLVHEIYPGVEYSLWVDGCLTPIVDPRRIVEAHLDGVDIAVFSHMERNCLYKELEACIRLRKDNPQVMRDQVNRYRKEGYPYNNGLGETTALIRRHTPEAIEFCKAWWEELRANSVRDQLSFDYLMWKRGMKYGYIRGNRCRSPYFHWRAHR